MGRRSASLACCLVASTPPKGTYHFLPGTLRCVIDSVEDASLSCPPPPVPCRALARKGNPSPFPGGKTRGMGLYPFPTPCRVWENGGGKKRFGGGRSQAPSAPGLL